MMSFILTSAHTRKSGYPVQTICAGKARSLYAGFPVVAGNERVKDELI